MIKERSLYERMRIENYMFTIHKILWMFVSNLEVHKSEVDSENVMLNFKVTLITFDIIPMKCCKGKLLHFYGIHVEKS